jgi:hypothetical protein
MTSATDTPAGTRLLRLRDGTDTPETIDTTRLTARARALADVVAARPLHTRGPVALVSTRSKAELGLDPLWHGPDMDAPHRTTWSSWARYPATSTMDPHEYLEREAAKLPAGYVPLAAAADVDVRADAELLTKAQVLELLRALGRPISPTTLDNYRSRPPAGWPQPARYVGRTPMWDRQAIETYARQPS